jgi:hypothetical protein
MNLILKKLVQEEVQNLIISHQGAIRALVKDMLVSEIRSAIRLEMPGLLDEAALATGSKIAPDNQAHCPSARATGRSPLQVGQPAPTNGQPAPTNGQPAPTDGQPAPTDGQPAPTVGQPVAPTHAVAGFPESSPKSVGATGRSPAPTVGRNDNTQTDCRYLYAIAGSEKIIHLGPVGIEDAPVYTITSNGLSAVVHACSSQPYQSNDPEIARGWLLTHHRVVESIFEQLGDVIPAGFDTIINGEGILNPDETVQAWLNTEHDALTSKLDRISGKQEYGVQIFWDPQRIAARIMIENEAIRCLNEEIRSKPEGAAYMYRQKLADMLKNEIEQEADRHFQSFYHLIQPVVDALQIEKIRKISEEEPHQMIMNLSCMLSPENKDRLGQELENIDGMDGFSVKFTGPWPPYSFV